MDPTSPSSPATPEAAPAAVAAPNPAAPNPEKAQAARELIEGIITRMGVTAEFGVEDRADGIQVSVKVTAGGEALGGGRRSGVLESITYLVNKSINRDEAGRKWVSLAVQGAIDAPPESASASTETASAAPAVPAAPAPVDPVMRAMAEELAARAKKLGGVVWVASVPTAMRSSLPTALGQVPNVKVRAEGEGVHRRLVVEAS